MNLRPLSSGRAIVKPPPSSSEGDCETFPFTFFQTDIAAAMATQQQIDAIVAALDEEPQGVGGLKTLWKVAKVHEEIVAQFESEGVESISDLYGYFGSKTYEEEAVTMRDKIESLKGRQIEVGRIRNAYHLAVEVIRMKGVARPEPPKEKAPDNMEAPLDEQDKRSMLEAWRTKYSVTLTMYLDPCDPLVNRLWREFRQNTPSLIPVERIRSTFQFHGPHPQQTQSLLPGVTVTVDELPDRVVKDIFSYYWALRVYANAAAKAGNYLVDSTTEPGKKVTFAPLDKNVDYADHAIRQATAREGSQGQMVDWLRERDVHTRGLVVNFMRNGMSQGEALTQALAKSELMWATNRASDPANKAASSGKRTRSPPDVQDVAMGTQPSKSSRRADRPKKQYASTGKSGRNYCVLWNQGRCAKREDQCPNHHIHACNVIKANGKVCGSHAHRSQNHKMSEE